MRGTIVEVTCFRQQGAATVSTPEQIACAKKRVADDGRLGILTEGDGLFQITGAFSANKYAEARAVHRPARRCERRRSRHFQQLRLQVLRSGKDRQRQKRKVTRSADLQVGMKVEAGMRALTLLAAAALVMMVTVVPSAQAPASALTRFRGQARGHVHEGRRADSSALVPELPSSRFECADVADHL